jgi:hypothetical protein
LKLEARIKIIPPEEIFINTPFAVQFEGLPNGIEVWMDDKWKMGNIMNGWLQMLVNTAGERELSVKINNKSFRQKIVIKTPSV